MRSVPVVTVVWSVFIMMTVTVASVMQSVLRFLTATVLMPLVPCSPLAAIKFSKSMQQSWLIASALGFVLDVFVYHTFSLFLKSVFKFLVTISTGTDKSTLASGLARTFDVSSCAFSGIYTY